MHGQQDASDAWGRGGGRGRAVTQLAHEPPPTITITAAHAAPIRRATAPQLLRPPPLPRRSVAGGATPALSVAAGGAAAAAGPAVPRVTGGKRALYRAEKVMEDKNLPKKKYLAMQRLRRDLERSSIESLGLDVNALKQQIADLKSFRELVEEQRLTIRTTQTECRMAIVHQYFKVIEYGIGKETKRALIPRKAKIDFMRSSMDEQLRFGISCGLDAFIEQCQCYTLYHAAFHYWPPQLQELPLTTEQSLILSRNQLHVRISRKTIEMIFPHLLEDEVQLQALIGREVVYPCEIRLYFDKNGKIVRHDATIDFVSGLNAVLHSLDRVGEVLDGAMITHGSIIVRDGSQAHPPMSRPSFSSAASAPHR